LNVHGEHLFEAARPRFVRIVDDLETNDAFKYLKRQLQRDGVDPRELDDPLYYYDDEAETYAPLTTNIWRSRIRRAATDA
jgi:hypothetical protein